MPFLQAFIASFFLVVTLVDPCDHTVLAKGTVILRDIVHGQNVGKDEVALCVTKIYDYDKIKHPLYDYDICVGGYTAWKTENCLQK